MPKRPRHPIGDDDEEENDESLVDDVDEELGHTHTGRADEDIPSDTPEVDCGIVYASARSAAEAAFVHGAKTEARPYQADAVAKLLSLVWLDRHAALTRPINYLVQHATGTGKSLTIAVLALTLLKLNSSGLIWNETKEDAGGGGRDGGGSGCCGEVFSTGENSQKSAILITVS